jgi:hypothetical protein
MTTPGDAHGVRDELQEQFDRLGIPARITVGTVYTTTSVVISPLPVPAARKLADALQASAPGTQRHCPHPGELTRAADGERCGECGALIYPRRAATR